MTHASYRVVARYALLGLLLSGCDRAAPDIEPAAALVSPAIGVDFDPRQAGTIIGRVRWRGRVPECPLMTAPISGADGKVEYRQFGNPNAAHVDPVTRVVQGAVIYLEGMESARSRPWDHQPVRVEIDVERIRIRPGAAEHGRVGFVRAGDEVEFQSTDAQVHVVSARGTAFFGLTLPEPARVRRKHFDRPGLVELSSGAARYWHRAYLWVGSHPYFAMTDAEGRFTLEGVPAGEYTLVAWLPNAEVASVDRDPNTGMVMRYHFAEPLRSSVRVHVRAGQATAVDCSLSK